MNRYYLKSLKLEQFRGFKQTQELEFHPGINILFGINGSGKSTILKALNFFLKDLTYSLNMTEEKEDNVYRFQMIDINNNSESMKLKMCLLSEKEHCVEASFDSMNNLRIDNSFLRNYKDSTTPLIASYSVERSISNNITEDTLRSISKPDPYGNNLETRVKFTDFIQWFNLAEAAFIQKQVKKLNLRNIAQGQNVKSEPGKKEKSVEIIQEMIESFTGLGNLALDRNSDPISLTVTKGNATITSQQMSDGEKCLLALVGDISRRLIQLHPDSDHPLEGPGIVLVDEADLHLHPLWQRDLIPGLSKTFPNLQLILTTHSPQILSHVQEGKIFRFTNEKEGIIVNEFSSTYGQDTNRILEEVMETPDRPEDIKKKLEKIYESIDSHNLDEAKKLISDLQKRIGNDSELDRASVILEIKEDQ